MRPYRITAKVRMRTHGSWEAKPTAIAMNERMVHLFHPIESENRLYPGEIEWTVDWERTKGWPSTAPCFFAEGDLADIQADQ